MTRHESEESEGEGIFLIVCDLCESHFATEQPNAHGTLTDNLPEGSISFDNFTNKIDICPKCRYEGAPAQIIVRSLMDLRLHVGQVKANVSDNGYRIARIAAANQYSRGERTHALHFQKKAYHSLSSIESSLNLLVETLNPK